MTDDVDAVGRFLGVLTTGSVGLLFLTVCSTYDSRRARLKNSTSAAVSK